MVGDFTAGDGCINYSLHAANASAYQSQWIVDRALLFL